MENHRFCVAHGLGTSKDFFIAIFGRRREVGGSAITRCTLVVNLFVALKIRCLVARQRDFMSAHAIRFAACLAAVRVHHLRGIDKAKTNKRLLMQVER